MHSRSDSNGRSPSPLDRRELLSAAAIAAGGILLPGQFGASGSGVALAGAQASPLLVHTKVPLNAEPPLPLLVKSWITPVERFYVRSHAANPQIDPDRYRLEISGLIDKPLRLSLAQLQQSKHQQTVTATMTCAGNRRNEHSEVKQVSGVPWGAGAIGNATWTGVPLAHLLKQAGVKPGAKHVWFEGLDRIEKGGETIAFGGSIPLAKAMGSEGKLPGALVTTRMNGAPLTADHGYPVRMVVPGFIGARSVKWLGRIVLSDRPSPNHYVSHAYKLVDEDEEKQWNAAEPIYRYPINAVICLPPPRAKIDKDQVRLRGYALPAGRAGAVIRKVELSADGGRTWKPARLIGKTQPFCWQLWEGKLPVTGATEALLVRATDSTGATQPEQVAWNLKGYLMNAWHRVPVQVEL